jgi:hypothetical protein
MKTKRVRHIGARERARQIWAELDHVQRRLFELQTGIAAPPRRRPRLRARDW